MKEKTLTSEIKISAFLYSFYVAVQKDDKTPVTKIVKEFELGNTIIDVLKEAKIIKNNGSRHTSTYNSEAEAIKEAECYERTGIRILAIAQPFTFTPKQQE